MGLQMQICLILCFAWSILGKFCVHLLMSSSKTKVLFFHSTKNSCFVIDLLHLMHLAFVAFCLSFINNNYLKQYNYYVNQSKLLTRFWTDIMSSVWNFCRWGTAFYSGETFQVARSKDKGCFRRRGLFMYNVKMVVAKAKKVMGIIFYLRHNFF